MKYLMEDTITIKICKLLKWINISDNAWKLLINTYDEGNKTSLYKIFLVWTPSSSGILPFCTNIFVVDWETPLDKATYNWSWLKTWVGR